MEPKLPKLHLRDLIWLGLGTPKYSLRSLMLAVSMVCAMLGGTKWYVTHERERLRHKWEVAHMLRSKGMQLGGQQPRPFDEMYTWRGCEAIDYTQLCTIGPCRNEVKREGRDITTLVATFPGIEDLAVIDDRLTGEEFRQLALLPKLRKLMVVRTPLKDEDVQWIKVHRPEIEFVYRQGPQ